MDSEDRAMGAEEDVAADIVRAFERAAAGGGVVSESDPAGDHPDTVHLVDEAGRRTEMAALETNVLPFVRRKSAEV